MEFVETTFADLLDLLFDTNMLQEWADMLVSVLTLIPAPMGILLTISVVFAIIRAIL